MGSHGTQTEHCGLLLDIDLLRTKAINQSKNEAFILETKRIR